MGREAKRPFRAALVGIDGAGKTSVARWLADRTAADGRFVVLHCIRGHQVPDGPLHGLSRHLETVSRAADALGDYELKLALLYLQMCMYGPTERFFEHALAPEVVLADRHPLVDAVVYLPLYGRAIRSTLDGGAEAKRPLDALREPDPDAYEAVVAWNDAQARRLGRATDLRSLGGELVQLLDLPGERMLANLATRFQTQLPDAVLLLDVDTEEALRRSTGRERAAELHETRSYLDQVRQNYDEALAGLRETHPAVTVHRIGNGGGSADEAGEEILERLSTAASAG